MTVRVAACGFYELFFNGERITRGLLSPYIATPIITFIRMNIP